MEEIRYQGSNRDLVWKSPIVDFDSGSVVIVNESQGAVFYMNGEASEELGAGLTVLETCQIPFIKKVIQKIRGTRTPFQAELYYVNKVEIEQLKWGTPPILYEEEGFTFQIAARGLYHLKVDNARKLIEKINGAQGGFDRTALENRFRQLVASAVDHALIHAIYENGGIIKAPTYRVKIMEAVRPSVEAIFEEYGMKITQFIIEHIHVDENQQGYQDLRNLERMKKGGTTLEILQAELEAKKEVIKAQGEAASRSVQGYTYQEERQFDVIGTAAANDRSMGGGIAGGLMQTGVGLGMMGAIGGMVKNNMTGSFGNVSGAQETVRISESAAGQTKKCLKCGAVLSSDAKFCMECGEKVVPEVPEDKMICPRCKNIVIKSKFCSECGEKLEMGLKTCPQCGHQFENGKFCPECGTKL